ncbi:MAG: polyribonucleotide nucleotidyltransferase [Planctomycetota bacterium]|nr:polyribonucleotide nucleotidyltransferase [Planctomycetota bacterium]
MDRESALSALNMRKHTAVAVVGDERRPVRIEIETGYVAKQANGSCVVRCGETFVLSTVCDGEPRAGLDFFPLTVDYREKMYAAGRIPGNFFRREQRPSDHETLVSRLTDRPLRPLFPAGYRRDTSCQSLVISYDQENEPDVLSMIGVSAALSLSSIPFAGPLGAVRIGLIDGRFVVNPTVKEREASALDLVVAGTEAAITMVECGAKEVSEQAMVEALMLAHREIKKICAAIGELVARAGKPKMAIEAPPPNPWIERLARECAADFRAALLTRAKQERAAKLKALKQQLAERYAQAAAEGEREPVAAAVAAAFDDAKDIVFRQLILDGQRVDGRRLDEVRPIVIDLDVIPRSHGSVLFTRGETQALMTLTLGTGEDEQLIDGLKEKYTERFLLHYNFPGFSVGEVEKRGAPGRREVGHGALARRALLQVLPPQEQFPYCIRLVSEILESNGSSSMATVCSGSMALMAGGVPISAPVAGIAMGLVKEGERYAILTDILGDEDHYGDMDFKVCGTARGITALQMDIKIEGITAELMAEALERARQGRLSILERMNAAIARARPTISKYAPQIVQIKIDRELIGKIIGKGGDTVRRIQDETKAKIDIDEEGVITIASPDLASIEKAKAWIKDLTTLPEVGRVYKARVTAIKEFGAFVEFLPETEGLLHISDWAWERTPTLEGLVQVGQEVEVKLVEVDERTGKFRLSRKALLPPPAPEPAPARSAGRSEPAQQRTAGEGRHAEHKHHEPKPAEPKHGTRREGGGHGQHGGSHGAHGGHGQQGGHGGHGQHGGSHGAHGGHGQQGGHGGHQGRGEHGGRRR